MATRTRKILTGCGIGCVGAILLSIGACVSFSIWIKQPGDVLEPQRLLGQDTTGYVEWSLRVEDPGTEAFVESAIETLERAQKRQTQAGPDWLSSLLKSRRQRNNARAMRELLPAVVAWTIRAGAGGEGELHVFTVSIAGLGNRPRLMDLFMRYTVGLKHSVRHGDEQIYTAKDSGAMFIRDNSFFLTNSETNARLIVDRLRGEAEDGQRDPTELEQAVRALPADRPLRGVAGNARGELWRIWRTLAELKSDTPPPEIWSAIRSATVIGGFSGQTAFAGTMDLQGPDVDWARTHADDFLARVRSDYGRARLPVELDAVAAGDCIRVSFRVDDVFAFLDEL